MDAVKNFAYGTVLTAPSPATSGTSLVLNSGQGALMPTPPFNATVWPTGVQPLASNAEILRVTGISTDTPTIVRAQEGTSARTIVVGDQFAATVTKKMIDDLAGPSSSLAPVLPRPYVGAGAVGFTNIGADAPMGMLQTVPFAQTINRVGFQIGTSSGNVDVGIYLPDGTSGAPLTRVVSSGSTACPASGNAGVTVAATVLTPGNYWALVAPDNGTASFGYSTSGHWAPYPSIMVRADVPSNFPLPAALSGSVTLLDAAAVWTIAAYGV